MKIICILAMGFILLACGHNHPLVFEHECEDETRIPEIRWVLDGVHDARDEFGASFFAFHLQWDSPLTEERLVLLERRVYNAEKDVLEANRYLIRFAAGETRSRLNVRSPLEYLQKGEYVVYAILEGREREKLAFPFEISALHDVKASTAHISYSVALPDLRYADQTVRLILKGHPFKPYKVGTPSLLRVSF